MARIVMVGGGIVGLCGALALQQDGHDVTVLERDPEPPGRPDRAWEAWPRRSVSQFRLPHGFLARFTQTLRAELPELAAAFVAAGARQWNLIDAIPPALTGGRRPDDDRFEAITGRRPLMEAVLADAAVAAGVDVRRGVLARGLLVSRRLGQPHVTGVITGGGEVFDADLVVDSGGLRTAVPRWLREAGAAGPGDTVADGGFVYFGRHYRSPDGSVPPLVGPVVQALGSISTATLAADHGTWSVVIFTASGDAALRALRDEARWEAVIRACPQVAHWIDAEPITGIDVMARIEDRRRHYVLDGGPVATGVLPLGDAWAATNPSLGRGISLGLLHAVVLRDALRAAPATDPEGLALAWQQLTDARVEPFVRDTLAFDRHRRAEMQAAIEGHPYETDDPGWHLGLALRRAAPRDPELLRGLLAVSQLLERGSDVLAQPGTVAKVRALDDDRLIPGPDRAELLQLVRADVRKRAGAVAR